MKYHGNRKDPWRVFELVNKLDSGCWESTIKARGGKTQHRMLDVGMGSKEQAHRVAYQLYYGIKLEKYNKYQYICHKCNNPICVNPKHLYLGTPQTNAQDAVKAKTHRYFRLGSRNPKSKLSVKQVIEIKRALASSNYRGLITKLAKQYNVADTSIAYIKSGKNWGHIKI